jgi:hypothetical protein
MCVQVNCPLQQAAPSRRECHRNRPRQSLLSPDFGYAPAAAACASEPGVLSLVKVSHNNGPSPVAACICEPRVSCEPGVSEMARRLLHAALGPAFQRLDASYRYLDPTGSPVSVRLLGWYPLFMEFQETGPTFSLIKHMISLKKETGSSKCLQKLDNP